MTQRRKIAEEFGNYIRDEDKTVFSTAFVAFTQFKEKNKPAAELLEFLALFHPDAIPLDIIKNAPSLNPALKPIVRDDAKLLRTIMQLIYYSLVERESHGTLKMNRHLQNVIKDEMDNNTHRILV